MLKPLTIAEASLRLRDRSVSSAALTEAALDAIARESASLNAFITILADSARAAAAQADRELAAGQDRGALHGIPISLKDLIDVAGVPTTAGSRVRRAHLATTDAPIVRHLREAGAVIVGKTNLHEFALGTTSEDSAYGPVRHPLDSTRAAGGSSGGSAVSVATGMSLGSVGTDTGGSIRIPAAACGLVGLKPAFGEVDCEGIVPLSRRLDHAGPIVKTVQDARLLLEGLTGRILRVDSGTPALDGVRAAVLEPYFLDRLQPEVQRAFGHALDRFRAAGVRLSTTGLPHAALAPAIYLPLCLAEAAALHAATLEWQPDDYTPAVRLRLELGRYVRGEDYVRALEGAAVLRREVDEVLNGCDLLLLPTLAIVAPTLGAPTVRVGDRDESVRNVMLKLTQVFNLTGHPALTLPIRTPGDSLPVGLQLVARSTVRLLDLAAAFEQAISGHR
jgi:aspartyl-tRNA(Asn)/glutamyl-tRNA(Gln) amidotransferase subunit A